MFDGKVDMSHHLPVDYQKKVDRDYTTSRPSGNTGLYLICILYHLNFCPTLLRMRGHKSLFSFRIKICTYMVNNHLLNIFETNQFNLLNLHRLLRVSDTRFKGSRYHVALKSVRL